MTCKPPQFITAAFAVLAVLFQAAIVAESEPTEPIYQRIISAAPSLTETLFALGLGPNVIGVTPFCTYPPEVEKLPKVGGYLDPNFEALVALNPDLILLLPSQREIHSHLGKLGLHSVIIRQETVRDIPGSIEAIGGLCGVEIQAAELKSSLETEMNRMRKSVSDLPRPRVLVCVGRDYSASKLDHVYIASGNSFHGELIDLAGGHNVYTGGLIDYPAVSGEGIIEMNPEVIVEMVPAMKNRGLTRDGIVADWKSLPMVPAVEHNRIHIFSADYVSTPGPRVINIIRDLIRVLHPEIEP
ncbi:ABC transporter substrate-binding protein [bacterium]|nr:ABC transporter substrate-binding protein [candidate division CSSED10-310 bacterium]